MQQLLLYFKSDTFSKVKIFSNTKNWYDTFNQKTRLLSEIFSFDVEYRKICSQFSIQEKSNFTTFVVVCH